MYPITTLLTTTLPDLRLRHTNTSTSTTPPKPTTPTPLQTPTSSSKDTNDSLPTITFSVVSIILAFASLIVGIIGVMEYRRRRHLCAENVRRSGDGILPVASPSPSLGLNFSKHQLHQNPTSSLSGSETTLVESKTDPLSKYTTSSSSLQSQTLKSEGRDVAPLQHQRTEDQKPKRPALEPLRLRTSLLMLDEGQMRCLLRTCTI